MRAHLKYSFYHLYFCVCALQTVRKQLDKNGKQIRPAEFVFGSGKELKIMVYIEVPGWQCAMESPDKVASLSMYACYFCCT